MTASAAGSAPSAKTPVRWGFVGAGFVASRALAPAVHRAPEAELTLSAARDLDRAAALEPRRAATDYRSVVEDPHVEVVYISLTNEAHRHWIGAALGAGKHVVCEKPLTLSGEECHHVQALAAASGRLLVEATWTRWHPRHRRAAALIAAGELGELREIEAVFAFDNVPEGSYRLDPARGGGALLDVGPYLLAPLADWFPVEWRVVEVRRDDHASGVDLRTEARLAAPDGEGAHLVASFAEPNRQELELTGSDLTLRWEQPAFTSWRAATTLTVKSADRQWDESFAPCDAYQEMVSAISRRVRGDDTAFVPDPQLSRRVADLLDAVRHGVGVR